MVFETGGFGGAVVLGLEWGGSSRISSSQMTSETARFGGYQLDQHNYMSYSDSMYIPFRHATGARCRAHRHRRPRQYICCLGRIDRPHLDLDRGRPRRVTALAAAEEVLVSIEEKIEEVGTYLSP